MWSMTQRQLPLASLVAVLTVSLAAAASSKAAPALQPADVYDSDFPVDMAEKTPQELRYQAQSDYAKAILALKKEAAEAEAARKIMEKQLKELIAAKEAAAAAEKKAAAAARRAEALRGSLGKETAEAAAARSDASDANKAISKEEAALAAANKDFLAAQEAQTAAEAKIAAMKAKHAELTAQIEQLEKEQGSVQASAAQNQAKVAQEKQGVQQAEQDLQAAKNSAGLEAQEAAAAEKEAAAAKAKLDAAQSKAGASGGAGDQTEQLQKDYELAKEKYTKEANDVKAAQERVAVAKAELAKWESAASTAAPAILALLLGTLANL